MTIERSTVVPLYPSALHRAVAHDDRRALAQLLDEGAEPSTGDPWINVLAFAVQRAILHGPTDLAAWLNQRCPALMDARTASGEGMLHRWAVHDGANGRSLRTWLEMGADAEAVDRAGNTPLLTAAVAARPEAIRALVRAGVNVHHQNERGESALMVTVNAWHAENLSISTLFPTVIRLLLDSGVDALLEDVEGASAAQRLGRRQPATAVYVELRDAEEMRKAVFHRRAMDDLQRSLNDPTVRRPRSPR